MLRSTLLLTLFAALLAGGAGLSAPVAAQQPVPAGTTVPEVTPCFIDGFRERVACYEAEMPIDYADPGAGTLTLGYVIIPARSRDGAADPLFVLAGGPGQAASEYGALANIAFGDVLAKRDLVLIDQRGTGRSMPLRCALDGVGESLEESTRVIADCRAGFDVDVSAFTVENVIRDMEAVRAAHGYQEINLWGVSYGTRTAALYVRRHPQRVRSMVLDGVLPPDVSLYESAPASAERAKSLLIEACSYQPSCAERYPALESQIEALMDQARAGDLHYVGPDPLSGAPIDLAVPFETAVEALRAVMYQADATGVLPYAIDAADQGNLAPLMAGLGNGSAVADSMHIGATLSILCGEEVERTSQEAVAAAAEASFAGTSYYDSWRRFCDGWDYRLPEWDDIHDPLTTDVPALLLSGHLDPVTPPGLGQHLADSLQNARHIIVPGTGHNTSFAACLPQLIGEFIETLDSGALDASCLDRLQRLPFAVNVNGAVR